MVNSIKSLIIFFIYVWVPEVGNTADTPNPLRYSPFKGNLGVPTGQWKFDLGGDFQISFKRVNTLENLVYRQYCLLPAPKRI